MSKQDDKKWLRTTMRTLEKKLSPSYKTTSNQTIVRSVLAMTAYQSAQTVFCFVGTEHELDTRPILEDALLHGKTLCVPCCVGDGAMELREISSLDALSVASYGILEPNGDAPLISIDQVDFSILPCLTCNHLGQRLGQGGGYYDRFLALYRGCKVLLCREKLIREEIPIEPHDYPIPWVLTEAGLFEDGTPARLG